jgi:hypothetical protein
MATSLTMDGGVQARGGYNWLNLEVSQGPNFSVLEVNIYNQPADGIEDWLIENLQISQGTWYWRGSVWCNGPGWPPPPNGYDRSPFSDVWTFTLIP